VVPRPGAPRDHEWHSFNVAAKNYSSNPTPQARVQRRYPKNFPSRSFRAEQADVFLPPSLPRRIGLRSRGISPRFFPLPVNAHLKSLKTPKAPGAYPRPGLLLVSFVVGYGAASHYGRLTLIVAFDVCFQMLGTCLSSGLLTMQRALLVHRIRIHNRPSSSIRHRNAGGVVGVNVPHERNFCPSSFLIYRRARDHSPSSARTRPDNASTGKEQACPPGNNV